MRFTRKNRPLHGNWKTVKIRVMLRVFCSRNSAHFFVRKIPDHRVTLGSDVRDDESRSFLPNDPNKADTPGYTRLRVQ